jgi:hypothetical protein
MMTMKIWGSFMTATIPKLKWMDKETSDKLANKHTKSETKTAHSAPMFRALRH